MSERTPSSGAGDPISASASAGTAAIGPVSSFTDIPPAVWKVVAAILPAVFMTNLDVSLVSLGLKTIAQRLHTGLETVQWISSGYLLALGAALALSTLLGRRFGFIRLWKWALLGFVVTSALCSLAPNAATLIAARVAEGLSGGILVPAGRTIIARTAGPKRVGRVYSVVAIGVVLAPALGPTVGGLMIAHLSWRWLFVISVLAGGMALLIGRRYLPRHDTAEAGPLDIPGLLLVSAGLPLALYGVVAAGQQATLTSVSVLSTLLPGIAALAAYYVRSARRDDALLDVRLFANRVFTPSAVTAFFFAVSMFGMMVLLPLYFQLLRGESVVSTGLLMIAFGAGAALLLPFGGWLTDRLGGGVVPVTGIVLIGLSTALLAIAGAHASLALIETALVIAGVGRAISIMPAVTTGYARVAHKKLPDAVTQVNMLQRVGGATGSGLFVVILSRKIAEMPAHAAPLAAFQTTFWWLTAANVITLVAAVWLFLASRRTPVLSATPPPGPVMV
jgi:EmrB/QacA subfamily drug resistance transporter